MRVTRFHYAWVVVAITFLALLVTSSVRAAPGILITPLEQEYGWDRAAISAAIAVSILTFGLGGPLSGTLVARFGPRRVILFGCSLVAVGLFAMLSLHDLWQFFTFWGIVVGLGTGAVGNVLGATVAHRWFRKHRGLILGAFGAATSTGQLVFIPAMATLTVNIGWRAAIALLLVVSVAVLAPVAIFMRDKPEDLGLTAFGEQLVLTDAERASDTRNTPLRVIPHVAQSMALSIVRVRGQELNSRSRPSRLSLQSGVGSVGMEAKPGPLSWGRSTLPPVGCAVP